LAEDTVRSEVAFAVDADNEKDAREKTAEAVKGAGFDVVRVGGVSRLIDYLPGEFLVHLVIDHAENDFDDLAGHAQKLYDDLVEAGIKPHSQPGSGFLAPDDSRLRGAQPKESSLLNDSGENTGATNNSSRLRPAEDDPAREAKVAAAPTASVSGNASDAPARSGSGDAGAAGANK
jgi:hypothetical protein